MSASINSGRPFDHELRSLWLRFVSLVRAAAAAAAAFFASMSLELGRRRPPPTARRQLPPSAAAATAAYHVTLKGPRFCTGHWISRIPSPPKKSISELGVENISASPKFDSGSTCFRFRLRNETKSFSEPGTFKLKPPRAFYPSAFYTRPLYSSRQKNKLLGLMLCRAYA